MLHHTQASRVLLGLPNSLGWRYHFGVRAPPGESATLGLATDAIKVLAQRSLVDSGAPDRVREAGLMLFTFLTEPPAQHAPMRVRVFETRSSSAASSAECLEGLSPTIGWYGHDEVLEFYSSSEDWWPVWCSYNARAAPRSCAHRVVRRAIRRYPTDECGKTMSYGCPVCSRMGHTSRGILCLRAGREPARACYSTTAPSVALATADNKS
jgi:hypothetical protein